MKLERVVINKFWGKYNLDLHLDSDVNILTGSNGSGKTTILDIIATLLSNKTEIYCHQLYDNATLYLSGKIEIKSVSEDGKKLISCYRDNERISYEDVDKDLFLQTVSTFDSPIMPIEIIQKMKGKHSWLTSDLDYELYDNLNDYYKFQVSRLSTSINDSDTPDMEKVREFLSVLNNFKKIANELFAPKKTYNDKDGEVFFTLNDDTKTKILLSQLSSGEKQMLVLLYTTIIQNNKECITFWDEPEVSLHIEWQRKLIRVIRQLNPNMQLIIATHSPSILFEGWENRALNIEDYLKDE